MEWIQLIISMIGVIGLIFFMFFLLKKVNRNASFVGGNKLRIIDRATLGRDSALAVVSVCGQLMLIGISAGRVEKICDLPVTEEEYLKSGGSKPQNAVSFADILRNAGIMKKKNTEEMGEFCNNSLETNKEGTNEDDDFKNSGKTE